MINELMQDNSLENLRGFISKKIYEATKKGSEEVVIKIDELEQFGYVHEIHSGLLKQMIAEPTYHLTIYNNSKNFADKRFIIDWNDKEGVNVNDNNKNKNRITKAS